MGNICSSCIESREQAKKAGVLQGDEHPDDVVVPNDLSFSVVDDSYVDAAVHDESTTAESSERVQALREEQARLEVIVATAGRDMVPVQSARSTPGYYDQGFAAALAQHLEEQMTSPSRLPSLPPPSAQEKSVYATLAKSPWQSIQLGTSSTGLAGCGGDDPSAHVDKIAESVLASMVPAKEQLFANVEGAMVENLL